MMDKTVIKLIQSEIVTEFLPSAEKISVYHWPNLIGQLFEDTIWIGCYKGAELVCVAPILIYKGNFIINPPHIYYSGPVWSRKWSKLPTYRKFATSQRIYIELIEFVRKITPSFSWSFSPGSPDLRAFQWYNYHSDDDANKFDIGLNYTAVIENRYASGEEDLTLGMRPDDKRKRVRKLMRNADDYSLMALNNIDCFLELYSNTMKRTNGIISDFSLEILEKICDHALSGGGNILGLSVNGNLVGAQLLLRRNGVCNAVAQGMCFGEHSKGYATLLNFFAVKYAFNEGDQLYDFNGANSPNRADDKHSFGAQEEMYFTIRI